MPCVCHGVVVSVPPRYTCGAGADEKHSAAVVQPVASEASQTRLLGYVADAVARGARVVCGGGRVDRPGTFLAPTVLADVHGEMQCAQEEIFGPLMTVQPFDSREDAFVDANDTDYGLSGYVRDCAVDCVWCCDVLVQTYARDRVHSASVCFTSGILTHQVYTSSLDTMMIAEKMLQCGKKQQDPYAVSKQSYFCVLYWL